jgi:Tfp pilus assembly pilus retraction ATPase PilT
MAFSWDRLFDTCIGIDASDILLLAGMPPLLKKAGRLRELAVPSLTAVEIGSMLQALSPLPERPNERGYFSFLISHQKKCWFRVESFGLPEPHFTILMRLSEPPEGDQMAEAR